MDALKEHEAGKTEPGTVRRPLADIVDDMAERTPRRFDRLDAAIDVVSGLLERRIRDRQAGSETAGR